MNKDKNKEEEENNLEPFIHEDSEFRTAFIGAIPEKILDTLPHQFDPKLIATLVKQLTALDSLQIKDEVLHTLKADEAQAILVAIIGMKEYANQRKIIVAACWESGLDFTNYFTFFNALALNSEYAICMEAVTVITENMAGPFSKAELTQAQTVVDKAIQNADERLALFNLLIDCLTTKLNSN